MAINLVLADDHPLVLSGLKQLFANESDFHVLACCSDGEAALQSVMQYHPDILVLDLLMPKMDGLSVLHALQAHKLSAKVVVLTAGVDEDEILSAIQLGAQGVVLKEVAPDLLIECLHKVYRGGKWLETDWVQRAFDKYMKRESNLQQIKQILTTREIDLVKLVANGYSNKQIANQCFISEGTVKAHLHNIYEKLGINNRVELCLYVRENELV